ncbi:MAG: alkaline phosphatase D family protein [Bacteroidales bacterium]
MKNLLKTLETPSADVAGISDGIAARAAEHLKSVKYPNRLNDVAVVGRRGDWHRSFLLRPKYGGRYLFLIYPKEYIDQETIIARPFQLQAFNSAPELLDIYIPASLRVFETWEWKVFKTEGATEEEEDYNELDALEFSDGLLGGRSATRQARRAMEEQSYSTLIYQARATIEGEVAFEEERVSASASIAMWSCHQPYASEDGKAVVKESCRPILEWYRQVIDTFSPHMIWMLGDSVYSDGTGTLDFVRQVYDRRGWQENDAMRKDLLSLYRLNYRFHWSFEALQKVMRKFPHLGMWDDHEIRDGYGSEESDFKECNVAIKQIASQAAEEYLFQYSPKLRSESLRNSAVDNHQAYVNGPVAAFIFDGRNSRNYGENMPVPSEVPLLASALAGIALGFATGGLGGAVVGGVAGTVAGAELSAKIVDIYRWNNPGEVVSDLQLKDFERYCNHIKSQPRIKYLIMGNSVPFIYILDFVESIAAESAIAGTDTGKNMRDDIRDSWHSPANRRQLSKLIDILRNLHHERGDIEIINTSGDIHLSNAYVFQPEGFQKPLFQVTSSALTNNPPDVEGILNLLSVDGPISQNASNSEFGKMERLWYEGESQNFLTISADQNAIELHLHVYDPENTLPGKNDRILSIRPNQGYTLKHLP